MSKTDNRIRGSVHQSHEAEARINDTIHEEEDEPWVRGASLDMPPARPGMDQRWIAFSIMGQPTPSNYMRKMREGWKPRAKETIPADFPVPTLEHGQWAGCAVVEGSVLCERPLAMSRRRDRHFRTETDRRTEAIDVQLESFNKANRNPAFGPIKKAIGDRKVMREVRALGDDENMN